MQSLPVPPFQPAKKKQSIRIPLKDEQAGASPVAGASFRGRRSAVGRRVRNAVTGVRFPAIPPFQCPCSSMAERAVDVREVGGANPSRDTIHTEGEADKRAATHC